VLKPRIAEIRDKATKLGRDPQSIKFFGTVIPIIGRTEQEAQEKLAEARKYASVEGGLALFSGWTGIDISKFDLDEEIAPPENLNSVNNAIHSAIRNFTAPSASVQKWTPRTIAQHVSLGGLGPVVVGSPSKVADELERWIVEADLDGFNIGYVITPGTFEDVVDLLVPELEARGLVPKGPEVPNGTLRENVFGKGQRGIRDDHPGSRFKYEVYQG
jgi:alkanesulfonate monooxygenase SsuD/methylene tetrahydromethanopterin reductase-like flavin-dependent oxidoreductase (luciferase family)